MFTVINDERQYTTFGMNCVWIENLTEKKKNK